MTSAVVPAAGKGTRLKTANLPNHRVPKDMPPKALIPLLGRPMIWWTVKALEETPIVNAIVLVAPPDALDAFERLRRECGWQKVVTIVPGGEDRQQSVWHGLQALPAETEWVIVHDGARPLVTPALITAVWEAAVEIGTAAIAAIPCAETVKRSLDGVIIAETLSRDQLWLAQTPQVFTAEVLKDAHLQAIKDGFVGTDDAVLVERLGVPIRIVLGSPTNIKITHPTDLPIAELLLRDRKE